MGLATQKCEPCQIGTPPLSQDEAKALAKDTPLWTLTGDKLEREFEFGDFRGSIDFINHVAEVAEEQGHHPDICLSYNKVKLDLTTHKIGGLSKNDFILAAKIDRIV
ncbi:MAG: 4a-hydroxytetrahydrobiopterin dehydratase [Armatimonadetes bacterium]|nr:4a-hydroxytetrahydrobiopterin dehydratase [Armatimonadota bacterium]